MASQARPRPRRALAIAALWIVFAEGDLAYAPALAALAVVGAIAAGELLGAGDGARVRVTGGLWFALYFAAASTVGGIDVARRALARRPRLRPALEEVTIELEGRAPAALFAGAVSLIPGTLCADQDGRRVTIHVIDAGQDTGRALRALERRAGAVFAPPARARGGDRGAPGGAVEGPPT